MANIFELLSHWGAPCSAVHELEQADVVATHEFGDQHTPSLTTRQMVMTAAQFCSIYHKPLICQFPGDQVARQHGVEPVYVVKEHLLKRGAYLDTEEVNRQIASVCEKHAWRKVVFISHPHHLWRVGENAKHHGLIPLFVDTRHITYDPNCPRKVLASATQYAPREIAARGLYWIKGWI